MSFFPSTKAATLLSATLNAQLSAQVLATCTSNHFLSERSELHAALKRLFANTDSSSKEILIFSDGVFKLAGDNQINMDDFFIQLCLDFGLRYEFIDVSKVLGCRPEDVHASVEAVSALKNFLKQRVPAPVFVLGSGSLTDVVKHTLFDLNWSSVPFIVLPTALTVTAFTSHFAVLEEAGAKRTRVSRTVDHCLWYAPVLSAAPRAMTQAGYGDLLARFVAYGDWYLAWKMGVAERYDELAFHLMEPFSAHLRGHASALRNWPVSGEAMEDLAAILAMAGIAMSVSGETTPLSGYEHTISHALDYLHLTTGKPLAWHGEQVALASLASAESYDQLLSLEKIDFQNVRLQSEERIRKTIAQLLQTAPYFGSEESEMSPEQRKARLETLQPGIAKATALFAEDYLKKHEKWVRARENIAAFEENWLSIREHLRKLVIPAAEMQALITAAGLPLVPEQLSKPTSALEYRWALRFAPFVRSRMSLADMIFWLGEDPALWATI
jgi:glycerol-1-phosphate dehydrogenase [NAD(P)+]